MLQYGLACPSRPSHLTFSPPQFPYPPAFPSFFFTTTRLHTPCSLPKSSDAPPPTASYPHHSLNRSPYPRRAYPASQSSCPCSRGRRHSWRCRWDSGWFCRLWFRSPGLRDLGWRVRLDRWRGVEGRGGEELEEEGGREGGRGRETYRLLSWRSLRCSSSLCRFGCRAFWVVVVFVEFGGCGKVCEGFSSWVVVLGMKEVEGKGIRRFARLW